MISFERRSADSTCSRVSNGASSYGAIFVAHVKGNRRHIKKPHKGGGENVLPGMLLHVVAAAGRINKTANAASFLQREFVFGDAWFEIVNDLSIFPLDDFCNSELLQFSIR